ncbi:hypothetical protein A5885_002806, partial [Enterococcus sp. 8E11_MSG4843]
MNSNHYFFLSLNKPKFEMLY